MVVVEGDEVVLAVGQNGHRIDEPHAILNASESFWGVVAVVAESEGLLDLDEPVAFTLDEFRPQTCLVILTCSEKKVIDT